MSIFQYEVLNPVLDTKKPHVDKRGFLVVPAINKKYRYFIEVARYNPNIFDKEYFLLLSTDKFDANCRTCRVDDYGRLKIKVIGEFKDYVNNIAKDVGNLQVVYIESADNYDVWQVSE